MKKEIRIGILVIAAGIIFYWGYNYLNNNKIFGEPTYYYAVYDEIKNLSESNPVRINGVKVGVVKKIKFPIAPGDNRVLIRLDMEKEVPIPENSVAKIESDLLGSNMVNIILHSDSSYLETGDTLRSKVATTIQEEVSLQMKPVKQKAENLMVQLDSVLAVVQYIFNEDTRDNIAKSFFSIKRTIHNLESTTGSLDSLMDKEKNKLDVIIANIESITSNLEDNNEKISRTFDNLAAFSDTLAKAEVGHTLTRLDSTLSDLQKVTRKIEQGQGSLGMLVHNDTLYRRLESSADNLDRLAEDIRKNPDRYVHFSIFGKNQNKKKKKEE